MLTSPTKNIHAQERMNIQLVTYMLRVDEYAAGHMTTKLSGNLNGLMTRKTQKSQQQSLGAKKEGVKGGRPSVELTFKLILKRI